MGLLKKARRNKKMIICKVLKFIIFFDCMHFYGLANHHLKPMGIREAGRFSALMQVL